MAFVKSLTNLSLVLSALCSIVFSQGVLPPTAAPQDQNLFSSLFSSTATGQDPSLNSVQSNPAPLTSFFGATPQSNFGSTNTFPSAPSPGFPTMGMPGPAARPPQRKNPMSGFAKAMLFRSMGFDNMWPLMAFGGMGGGMGGGMFSNPLLMMGLANM